MVLVDGLVPGWSVPMYSRWSPHIAIGTYPIQYTREAVMVEALKTWEQLGAPAWSTHHDTAWPALSSFVTSPSVTLRKAVQSVLATQLRTQFGTAAG